EVFPKLRPAFTQMPTNENVGIIGSLLVRDAILVGDAPRQLARFEIPIAKLLRKSDHDQRLRWRIAVAARPERIRSADGPWQSIVFAIKVNRSAFAVIARENGHARALLQA